MSWFCTTEKSIEIQKLNSLRKRYQHYRKCFDFVSQGMCACIKVKVYKFLPCVSNVQQTASSRHIPETIRNQ